jgi:hypothetical protein
MNRSSGLFWGIVLVLLGLFFLFDNLDLLSVGEMLRDYWPVLFVLWGVWMIGGGALTGGGEDATSPGPTIDRGDILSAGSSIFGNVREHTGAETVAHATVFGDIVVGVSSRTFRGGNLSTVFGNCTCDASGAIVASGEHVLRGSTVFGTISITLPTGVPRAVAAHTLFGKIRYSGEVKSGFSTSVIERDQNYASAISKLRLEVSSVFGDVKLLG